MIVSDLLAKARQAAASAHLLLDHGDVDGACNRAYYAMFDAAKAALQAAMPSEESLIRSHSGLIAAFGLRLVKPGQVAPELGKALNRVFDIRQVADYTGEAVSLDLASWAVAQADIFVTAMERLVADARPIEDRSAPPKT